MKTFFTYQPFILFPGYLYLKDGWVKAWGHQNGKLSVYPQIIVINVIPLTVTPPSSFFSLPLLLLLVELHINWKDLLEESCLQGLSAVSSGELVTVET
jgi:hypothetical protein